jgi:glycosyltransferase involved in cell wall biosynthesis
MPIILAGADCVDNPVKGMGYLLKAIEQLQANGRTRFQVVAFGARLTNTGFPSNWKCVGPIRDENLLNLYYNAAVVYVSPTLAETFGLTLAEAVAAGTPAVVFKVGGCVDTVVEGVTGFLANYRDSESLANCIGRVMGMNKDECDEMSRRCRQFSEERYLTPPIVEQRYASLLTEMLGAHAPSQRRGAS